MRKEGREGRRDEGMEGETEGAAKEKESYVGATQLLQKRALTISPPQLAIYAAVAAGCR